MLNLYPRSHIAVKLPCLITSEISEAANIITDFTVDEDVIGIAGLGISYGDITITSQGNDALISANNLDLGIIQNVDINSLSESDFAFV